MRWRLLAAGLVALAVAACGGSVVSSNGDAEASGGSGARFLRRWVAIVYAGKNTPGYYALLSCAN